MSFQARRVKKTIRCRVRELQHIFMSYHAQFQLHRFVLECSLDSFFLQVQNTFDGQRGYRNTGVIFNGTLTFVPKDIGKVPHDRA